MTNVSVLGLGIMGGGIAQNILKAGFPLTVYNRTRAKAAPLVAAGARWADSPAEAAQSADVIVSVVGDDAASHVMWLGEHGALRHMRPGAVAIECSTLSLEWTRELHAAAREQQVLMIDAPLAGSKLAAQEATLTLFVGAEPEALEAAQPVLAAFSSKMIHFGPPGSGVIYKLINNLQGAAQIVALGEGVALAERAGLNMVTVAQTLAGSTIASPIVKGKVHVVIDREYADTQFALRWMHKDLTYALRLADELGVAVPLVAEMRELFRLAMSLGMSELDWAAIAEVGREGS